MPSTIQRIIDAVRRGEIEHARNLFHQAVREAKEDERRRIDDAAKKLHDAYGNVEAYWLTENDVWSAEGEYAPTFTEALEAATQSTPKGAGA